MQCGPSQVVEQQGGGTAISGGGTSQVAECCSG